MYHVASNLAAIRDCIGRAASRVGRDPADITLIGAAKQVKVARLHEAVEAGLRHVGENYVQEALPKIEVIGSKATWHFLGRLQTNKVRQVVGAFDYLHSLDRLELFEALERRALDKGRTISALIEVNLGKEKTKTGASVEIAQKILEWNAQSAISNPQSAVPLVGLMTMPPPAGDPEDSRRYFRELREMRDEWRARWDLPEFVHLSMGMSSDFEVAIEEGATMVRVGTALFGPRL